MRITHLLAVPLLAALMVPPIAVRAQGFISISFGARLGPEVRVFAYSPDRLGEWRTNYRRWTPVTLYDVNGRYYRQQVRGARPVLVYRYNNDYFFPPQDQRWNGADNRYDYRRRPNDSDYGRGRQYSSNDAAPNSRYGTEVGVLGYSRERAGDWHTNMMRWTPVVMYEIHGRYFPKGGDGARAVSMYRYHDEYFLPPNEPSWSNADRRFDYSHRPTREDYDRMRDRP